jgi:uncharacterized cupredoxin-like copper-binding protein
VTNHRLPVLGAVVVVVAVLTGCGGGNGSSGGGEQTTTSTRASGGTSSGGSPTKTVTISETEFKLSPSSVTLKAPGTYTFRAVNKGSVTHALEIEGSGVEQETEDIAPGESATVKVTFKGAGSFEMYCPVDGHKDQGMEGKITIGSAGAGAGGTTTDTDTNEMETETDSGSSGY